MSSKTASAYALEMRRTFRAPRERVYRAWTELAALDRWMCRDVAAHEVRYTELDVRPGGKYQIEVKDSAAGATYVGHGVYREVRPPEKLVFTWAWKKVPLKAGEAWDDSESVVIVEFIERGAATEMLFRHERLRSEGSKKEHEAGWKGCFEKLEQFLEA